MKKINFILFLCLTLISCNKSNSNNNDLVETLETGNPYVNTSTSANPITIEYSNSIDGYKVSVSWIIKEYANFHEIRYFVGPATLKFTSEENGDFFYIQHPEYSIEISKDNLKYISLENSDIFRGNQSFTQKSKYIAPSTNKVGVYNDNSETYDGYIPFFFQDVNFDNKKELILTYATLWEKGGSENVLFSKLYGNEFVPMKEEPFSNFNGFYNGYKETLAYGSVKIDYENKKIIYRGICGAMCSVETIYEFKKSGTHNSYTLFQKTELYNDEEEKEKTVTTYELGKPINIKMSKLPITID